MSSSKAGMPRTGGGITTSRTRMTRISPLRSRRNYRRGLEFLVRKNSAEMPEERNVTVEDEALPEGNSNGESRSEISEFMDEVKGHKEGRNY